METMLRSTFPKPHTESSYSTNGLERTGYNAASGKELFDSAVSEAQATTEKSSMSSSNVRNATLCLVAVFPAFCLAEYKVDCPKSVEYEISVSVPTGGWSTGFRPGASSTSPPKAVKRKAVYQEAVLYFEGDVDDAVELKGVTGKNTKGPMPESSSWTRSANTRQCACTPTIWCNGKSFHEDSSDASTWKEKGIARIGHSANRLEIRRVTLR